MTPQAGPAEVTLPRSDVNSASPPLRISRPSAWANPAWRAESPAIAPSTNRLRIASQLLGIPRDAKPAISPVAGDVSEGRKLAAFESSGRTPTLSRGVRKLALGVARDFAAGCSSSRFGPFPSSVGCSYPHPSGLCDAGSGQRFSRRSPHGSPRPFLDEGASKGGRADL